MGLPKPVIFISYSHKDEPDRFLQPGEFQWLSYVKSFLDPAETHGLVKLWDDRRIDGGGDWRAEIDEALEQCAVCVFLVSRYSLSSRFILDVEMKSMLERHHARGAHLYPIVITSTDLGVAPWLRKLNLKPTNGTALDLYDIGPRNKVMADLAAEIRMIVERAANPFSENPAPDRADHTPAAADEIRTQVIPPARPPLVHIAGLPETGYERLVGRDAELKRLDEAWADRNTNILSLVAEGGAGKSALVNEWLKRMQAGQYRGAEAVLGWSFYSQGSKERATSAEPFLNWALDKLAIKIETTSAPAKGENIACALAQRRVLLVLDGCEPLQHGLGTQQGELKDLGLRALLRRFAAMPPAEGRGLVVLTSRQAVKDIARWKDGAAAVLDLEELSEEAGAALLRDNGVQGTEAELRAAAREFGGHPLALGLLASFLKETRGGDVRRRDRIRELLDDPENPRHDHARRVMESYEKEWLAGQPVPHAITYMVGLFDRPASDDCLATLRRKPAIPGFTDAIVNLDEGVWQRAVARLRDVRLLAPPDRAVPDALDAHPLVREWFGRRLESTNPEAWRAAHGRLYEHLRDTTREGNTPTLEDLAPLYQAIPHGCRASRHQEARDEIYRDRLCRRFADGDIEFYAQNALGAIGSNLAAISWFFEKPYVSPVGTLTGAAQGWVLNEAARSLCGSGRFGEALAALRTALRMSELRKDWRNAARAALNLSEAERLTGEIAAAVATAEQSVAYAKQGSDEIMMMINLTTLADVLHSAGRGEDAGRRFAEAEQQQKKLDPNFALLYSLRGYQYCDLLLAKGEWSVARERASQTLEWVRPRNLLLDIALDTLTLGRAALGLALGNIFPQRQVVTAHEDARAARVRLGEAANALHAASHLDYVPRGLLARGAFRRSVGDWHGAARDLDEVEETAEPGPMRLYLCDMALERARLAFARIAAFAPLNGLIDDSRPKPTPPGAEESAKLAEEARANLATARELIARCGYHRRDGGSWPSSKPCATATLP
jgi:tetratricopeptide (TPR) repeat protein